jgi:hypothetical protein
MSITDIVPSQDASLGLIYRLNILWAKTDYAVLEANYDKWDILLDRIYANLLYREEMEVVEEINPSTGQREIKSVELSTKDKRVYVFLSKQIYKYKRLFNIAKNPNDKSTFRSNWYHACQKKDIWLRKLMMKNGLYLKENLKTPGSALFGNFGKGRK